MERSNLTAKSHQGKNLYMLFLWGSIISVKAQDTNCVYEGAKFSLSFLYLSLPIVIFLPRNIIYFVSGLKFNISKYDLVA